ncbi:hypothetical protein V5799_018174 [Amblyomma americanum]|uniref:Globin domain-containing protein n=1 Tax=Amblyomma americanum TaxID=6943 RepID=A0AAQ4F0Z2_AMBAM
MTDHEKKLVRRSWHKFCQQNPDYGVLIFVGMFTQYPDYLELFPRFRGRDLRALEGDPKFRAHACAVGHQLSALVECMEEPDVLAELIRKNAVNHLARRGVEPEHFESLLAVTLEQMMSHVGPLMTPAAVRAWKKLFKTMNVITRNVYDEVAEFSASSQNSSSDSQEISVEPAGAGAVPPKPPPSAEGSGGVSAPLADLSAISGTSASGKGGGQAARRDAPRQGRAKPAPPESTIRESNR